MTCKSVTITFLLAQASLERARRAARAKEESKAMGDNLAAETVRRREQREQRLKEECEPSILLKSESLVSP